MIKFGMLTSDEAAKDECRVQVEQRLNPDVLGPHLYTGNFFTERDYQCFTCLPSKEDQSHFILDKLRCGSVQDFEKFCEILRSNPQAFFLPTPDQQIGRHNFMYFCSSIQIITKVICVGPDPIWFCILNKRMVMQYTTL